MDRSRSRIHLGEGAIFTFRTIRAVVPGAQLRVRGLHVQQLAEHAVGPALHHRVVEGEGDVKGGGHLPGQTDDGEAVGPVGSDLELHHVVVGVDDGLDVVTGLHAPPRGG